jgi:hypothetical protein
MIQLRDCMLSFNEFCWLLVIAFLFVFIPWCLIYKFVITPLASLTWQDFMVMFEKEYTIELCSQVYVLIGGSYLLFRRKK